MIDERRTDIVAEMHAMRLAKSRERLAQIAAGNVPQESIMEHFLRVRPRTQLEVQRQKICVEELERNIPCIT